VIVIDSLRKSYRGFTAVSDLSLQVAPGELYGFLGPNGAGKTTTIKGLVGLLHPSAGRVSVAGHDLTREPEQAKRRIGYIPDRPFLYEKLTGAELIRYLGALYGAEPHGLERRARELLERLELGGWEGELVESYSYGMRQKIVLTAVLARDPQVLVIDEPMVGLDPRAAKQLRELLDESTRAGKAVLMSTHSVGLAEQVAHRIGIIHHGRLVAEGTMDQLRAQAERAGSHLEEVFLALTASEREATLGGDGRRRS
jgi:ABC-2 type transport system ATP-binding protein